MIALDNFHSGVVTAVFVTAVAVFFTLFFISAPYGRHAKPGLGPMLPARLGWIFMECPSALLFFAVYAVGTHAMEAPAMLLAALWLIHYVYRAFIFPFRLTGRPIPFVIAASGFSFNLFNAWMNARWISHLGTYPSDWLTDPRLLAGVLVFALGWAINQHADAVLLRLSRAPRDPERRYTIPHGGLYRWVSCPNYFGEILEWGGWALASWSASGAAFFVFTIANLAPRAIAHHRWYRATFADYPPERRALVPLLV